MANQLKATESGSSELVVAQPDQGESGQPDPNRDSLFEGRSVLEMLFYCLHQRFPEDMDLTGAVVKQFSTHGLLTTVIFERVP